jgi:hypothetical protein
MSIFCSAQDRTKVYAEAYCSYVAGENPRRTLLRAKRAIYGWKLIKGRIMWFTYGGTRPRGEDYRTIISEKEFFKGF